MIENLKNYIYRFCKEKTHSSFDAVMISMITLNVVDGSYRTAGAFMVFGVTISVYFHFFHNSGARA